ncbi:MAG TPA: hypothetical protein VNZ52_07990 [Candidatus Thermoplasmatota archaeon]|nr:hypothetical protein [Candidatus Thermoplasmatota archaeon]
MHRRVALLAVLPLVLAGCVQTDGALDQTAPPGNLTQGIELPFDPLMLDHDHGDASLHEVSFGFQQLAHHPLGGGPGVSSGAHVLDVKAGYLFVGAYGESTVGTKGGFYVYDLKNPEEPALVGKYLFPGSLGGDRSLEATADGNYVILGTEALTCAGHVNPFGPGIHLVDVSDKANPRLVFFYPTSGTHAVATHRIGDKDIVYAVSGGTENLFQIDRVGPLAKLTPIGELGFGHDLLFQDDPLLNTTVLYAADGGGPLNIYDVADPANPVKLGTWNIPDRGDRYYVHTVAAEIIEGRRIVVVSSEDWLDYASPFWILDATNFEVIETLSMWTNPGNVSADGLRFSLHNPRLEGGILHIAHYHGGVWSFDLRKPEYWSNLPVLGVHLPHEDTGYVPGPTETSVVSNTLCGAFNLADVPLAFDVETGDGVLYVADIHTGLYTLKASFT